MGTVDSVAHDLAAFAREEVVRELEYSAGIAMLAGDRRAAEWLRARAAAIRGAT
jgi:hypothetical protein